MIGLVLVVGMQMQVSKPFKSTKPIENCSDMSSYQDQIRKEKIGNYTVTVYPKCVAGKWVPDVAHGERCGDVQKELENGGSVVSYIEPSLVADPKNGAIVEVLPRCLDDKLLYTDEDMDDAVKIARDKRAKADQTVLDRKVLWNLLRTNPISDKDMLRVLEIGSALVPYDEGGFSNPYDELRNNWFQVNVEEEQNRKRSAEIIFNDALRNQFLMRDAHTRNMSEPNCSVSSKPFRTPATNDFVKPAFVKPGTAGDNKY